MCKMKQMNLQMDPPPPLFHANTREKMLSFFMLGKQQIEEQAVWPSPGPGSHIALTLASGNMYPDQI